jgi:RHS repeat-associated protein
MEESGQDQSQAGQGDTQRHAVPVWSRRGRDPLRPRSRSRVLNADAGLGEGNYLLAIPLLILPGRKLNVSLTLYYNSQVWTGRSRSLSFDQDHGWPAPGWSLGFGKAVADPYSVAALHPAAMLQDADGTQHPWSRGGKYGLHTVDGTLIDYGMYWRSKQGEAAYPNGTHVYYGAMNPGPGGSAADGNGTGNGNGGTGAVGYPAMYPAKIVDANGNVVDILYVNNTGPAIDRIQDTLGRDVQFHYDADQLLTAITAPGLNGATRTVVRFHYSPLKLVPQASPAQGIDAIFFPGTSTGYWFGDPDSYTADSGIITKVSERRAMAFDPGLTPYEQGSIMPGIVTHERRYDYPARLQDGLPNYKTMTESWEGMDSDPAVTSYVVQFAVFGQSHQIDTVYPDGTKVTQLMFNHPRQYDDGRLYQTMTYDLAGALMKKSVTTWGRGDYESPRITLTQVTDQLGQTTSTGYGYSSPVNQLVDVSEYDYPTIEGWSPLLRRTHIEYVADPGYANRHIFNLPALVQVYGPDGIVAARTEYEYDNQALVADPPGAGWLDPRSDYRGNITQITRYADAVTPANAIIETRRYDIAGNVLEVTGVGCQQSTYAYDRGKYYAYLAAVTCGAADPASPARLTRSYTYDFDTGLMLTSTDPNNRVTQNEYDPGTLRVRKMTLPTGAYIEYDYDDAGLSVVQTTHTAAGDIAMQMVTRFNGVGLVKRTEILTGGGASNAVSTQYDALGRQWKRSQPYRINEGVVPPLQWTEYTRDALGRVISVRRPDGSETIWYHDEQRRPTSASSAQGQTIRIQSPLILFQGRLVNGADRWFRTDALGALAEVVEPDAYESWPGGSVFGPGGTRTTYTYNALGLLLAVQGAQGQKRTFQYDSLGRLTAQYLPEKTATLDSAGTYVGPEGRWSDVFTYDKRSNLASHTDARGVKAIYDYAADPIDPIDPLNRLFQVSYALTGPPDPSIVPTAPVMYSYMEVGDLTRLYQVTMTAPVGGAQAVQEYAYDPQGRPASSSLAWTVPGMAIPALQLDYNYDTLSRPTSRIYPAQLGAAGRKQIDYTYGFAGELSRLRVDGADYASQLTYNPAGQVISVTVGPAGPRQTTETYEYDSATDLLASQRVLRGQTPLLHLGYTYWSNDQLAELIEGGGQRRFAYRYDALGRLRQMIKAAGPDGPEWGEEYTFDVYGNRTAVTASGTLNGAVAPPDGLPAVTYDPASNRITTPGFSYDAAGNQTRAQRADGSWLRYKYDQAGHLAQVADDSGQPLESYGYAADGARLVTMQGPNRTYYFWDQGGVIAEYTRGSQGAVAWSRSRVYLGNRILASFTPHPPGEAVNYHHPDRLGTRLITNNLDNTASEQTTLPFGTPMPNGSQNPVNPIFTTYDRNPITGLDYAVNRSYDPSLRFTQPDRIVAANLRDPQSLNLYSYVRNDPVNLTDPSGLDYVTVTECDEGDFVKMPDGTTAFVQTCTLYAYDLGSYSTDPGADPIVGASGGGGAGGAYAQPKDLGKYVLAHLGYRGPTLPQTTARPTSQIDIAALVLLGIGALEVAAAGGLAASGLWAGLDALFAGTDVATAGGGTLNNVLSAIEQQYAVSAPTTVEGAFDVVQQATASLGLEVGVMTEFSAAGMVLQNVGGVITTLTATGGITIVNAAGLVILQLGH